VGRAETTGGCAPDARTIVFEFWSIRRPGELYIYLIDLNGCNRPGNSVLRSAVNTVELIADLPS
jgi:hypothetical protein